MLAVAEPFPEYTAYLDAYLQKTESGYANSSEALQEERKRIGMTTGDLWPSEAAEKLHEAAQNNPRAIGRSPMQLTEIQQLLEKKKAELNKVKEILCIEELFGARLCAWLSNSTD